MLSSPVERTAVALQWESGEGTSLWRTKSLDYLSSSSCFSLETSYNPGRSKLPFILYLLGSPASLTTLLTDFFCLFYFRLSHILKYSSVLALKWPLFPSRPSMLDIQSHLREGEREGKCHFLRFPDHFSLLIARDGAWRRGTLSFSLIVLFSDDQNEATTRL